MKIFSLTVCCFALFCSFFFCSIALRAQQNPDRQFGIGMMTGQAGSLVNVAYAFSPNIQAGIALGSEGGVGGVSGYGRFLLPIGTTGISPFVKAAYNVRLPRVFNNIILPNSVGLAAGLSYCINQRVSILTQLSAINFGITNLTPPVLFTDFRGFPNVSIGVEFYF
jgi:hypothetical protein